LLTQAYWVPNSKAGLLSPQKLFNKKKGTFGQYQGDEESFCLILNDNPPIDIPYDIRSSLPIGYARTGPDLHPQVNTVLSIETKICQIHRNFYWTGTIDLLTSILHESNKF
jgi:hypothetical protein